MSTETPKYKIVPVDDTTFITAFPDDDKFIIVTMGKHQEEFKYNAAKGQPESVGYGSKFGEVWSIADDYFKRNPPKRKAWYGAKDGEAWLIKGKLAPYGETIEVVALVDNQDTFIWDIYRSQHDLEGFRSESIFSDSIEHAEKMTVKLKEGK